MFFFFLTIKKNKMHKKVKQSEDNKFSFRN